MSGISSVSTYTGYSPYSTITNGGRITQASQDAAGLAIQEKTNSQVRGLDQGKDNLSDGKSLLNIQDGALGQIGEYLQDIREKSLQAMNGTLSDSDRQSIQDQIKQYMDGINDIAGNTTFNEKKLLDGSAGDLRIASDNNGSEEKVSTYDSTIKALGLDGYDVTGDFDISKVDEALKKVTGSRTSTGAQTNAVDYAMTYNSHAAMELNGYQMDKEESMTTEALQKLKTQQALDQYQTQIQKKQMEDEQQKAMSVFA